MVKSSKLQARSFENVASAAPCRRDGDALHFRNLRQGPLPDSAETRTGLRDAAVAAL